MFVLLRLLAVSHYDWHVAFALLHTLDLEDAPGLFVGTFMADSRISSALLILVSPLLVLYAWAHRRRDKVAALALPLLPALMVAHVITYHRWWVPVAAVALSALVLLVERARMRGLVQEAVTFLMRRTGVVLVGVALAVAAFVATPWVPLEEMELVDGELRGYVMETGHGFVKVLDEHHGFRILRTDEIRSRVELAEH
ncbi:hypothetical protein CNX65_05845 [Actinosynnema pretiosum]|uniref:Uncharacterized protein n=2 Tax=Pseudonocardiaceae TaxID=2070 RepID=A0A290ZGA7_9PSEU|nr:hypothetical protein CNX65_05845 [Actinosynnema pretiosum]